ncbi:hypothetical protein BO71DRAFT_485745 [Aspergillus ellipticus CBS 707.79]|uniref:Zn(2)-C6 fungal-type domain-containing protein n=1 Tax=Aspergillus ellipticus CBS 707.79 TaxID=1448320 RepID=A0A319DCQ3_9EURO|nr:hypothetical protein BO71DRAFT_485745 [Aspergillus ellipticus CBS 707.79]
MTMQQAEPSAGLAQSKLRNSCDLCYVMKLRCTREKPTCSRCRKNAAVCAYSPTKRPGRPRRGIGKANQTSSSTPSLGDLVADRRLNQPLLDGSYLADQLLADSSPWDLSSVVFDQILAQLNDQFEPLPTEDPTSSLSHLEMGISPSSLSHLEMGISPSNSDPYHLAEMIDLPRDDQPPIFLPTGPMEYPPTPQSETDHLLPGESQFLQDCMALKGWASTSRSLALLAQIDDESSPSKLQPLDSPTQCLCPMAIIQLQLHHAALRQTRPDILLAERFHLQRLLMWTWRRYKDCIICEDENLARFTLACVGGEVMTSYYSVVDEAARHQAVRPGPEACLADRSALELAQLEFASKDIQGPVKTTFLRRLIGRKVQDLGRLLPQLLQGKRVESEAPEHLRLLVSGIVEQAHITTGMLSTLQ